MPREYNPADNWTLAMENQQVGSLSVTELLDCLMVKIQNSNGLDFCPKGQVVAAIELLKTRHGMPAKHSFLPLVAHVLNASAYVLETQSDKPKSIAEIASILRDTADDVRKIAKD